MYKWLVWLFALFTGLHHVPANQKDYYVGVVAAEAAYASLLAGSAPVKPKVPQRDCTTCNGTGKVRTGDDQEWTKCPDCEPEPGRGDRPVLKSTAPAQNWPARTVPAVGG